MQMILLQVDFDFLEIESLFVYGKTVNVSRTSYTQTEGRTKGVIFGKTFYISRIHKHTNDISYMHIIV